MKNERVNKVQALVELKKQNNYVHKANVTTVTYLTKHTAIYR